MVFALQKYAFLNNSFLKGCSLPLLQKYQNNKHIPIAANSLCDPDV